MLALPSRRCCGCVDCGGEDAEGAFATGSEGPSLASPVAVRGGGGSCAEHVCHGPRGRGGDRRHGMARLLRAAEMLLKTSGSAAGGSVAGGRGCFAGKRGSPAAPVLPWAGW